MRSSAGLIGGAVLAFWGDVDAEHERQFNDWYTHEHLPERIGVPGFLRGRRYEATEASPGGQRFFTLYETESVDTLASDAYLERLDNPTELTRAVVPVIRNMDRGVFRVVATVGDGVGGFLGVLRLSPASDAVTAGIGGRLADAVLPRLLEHPHVVSAHLCEADVATTQAKDGTAEGEAAGPAGAPAGWLVLVEATHEPALGVLAEGAGDERSISASAAYYRLMVSLSE